MEWNDVAMLTILNSWNLPVFYLRSIAKWPHTVKAHIGGSKINIFKINLRTVSLVPSWLSVTQMRLPVDKSENKNKNIGISH